MAFILQFNTDNAAFEADTPGSREAACVTILQRVEDYLWEGTTGGRLFDENGNHIGHWVCDDQPLPFRLVNGGGV